MKKKRVTFWYKILHNASKITKSAFLCSVLQTFANRNWESFYSLSNFEIEYNMRGAYVYIAFI